MNKSTIVLSLIYKFTERLAVKILGLIISIVLARILAPEDFGQVAILTVFINISQTIIQSGLNTALVQNKDVTEKDYSTVFHISFTLAIVLIIFLYIIAPYVEIYYDSEMLATPLRIYSFSLLFGAFNSVQVARLQRNMMFKQMMICSLIATIVSGALGIALAYFDFGIWSLILYYFSNVVVSCFSMLLIQKWIPIDGFSLKRAKILFDYGWKILMSALLCSIYGDIRSLIIGKKFSAGDLGYYDRGQQFPSIIAATLDVSIQSVMLPALSSVQDNKITVKNMLRRATTTSALVVLPAMVGLAAVAEPLVTLLLTEKWLPCVIFMQLICFAEARLPFTASNTTVIKALGEAGLFLKLELIRRVVMMIILIISVVSFDSVLAIAVGYVISSWIDVVIISIPMKKMLNYSLKDQVKDNWKMMLSALLMGISLLLINQFKFQLIVQLIVDIISGACIYFICCYFIKAEPLFYALNECKGFVRKGRRDR